VKYVVISLEPAPTLRFSEELVFTICESENVENRLQNRHSWRRKEGFLLDDWNPRNGRMAE